MTCNVRATLLHETQTLRFWRTVDFGVIHDATDCMIEESWLRSNAQLVHAKNDIVGVVDVDSGSANKLEVANVSPT